MRVEHGPRRNIKVENVMRPAVSVTPETTAREVLKILRENNVPGVPVVNEDGRLEGFVTDGHLMDSALPRYMKMMGNLSFVPDNADEWVHYLTDAADQRGRAATTPQATPRPRLVARRPVGPGSGDGGVRYPTDAAAKPGREVMTTKLSQVPGGWSG